MQSGLPLIIAACVVILYVNMGVDVWKELWKILKKVTPSVVWRFFAEWGPFAGSITWLVIKWLFLITIVFWAFYWLYSYIASIPPMDKIVGLLTAIYILLLFKK